MTVTGHRSPGLVDSSGQKPGCPGDLPHSLPTPSHEQVLSAPRPARSHFYPPFPMLGTTTLTRLSYSHLSLPNCALHFQMPLSTPLPIHFPPRSQSLGHMMSFTRRNLYNELVIKTRLLIMGCQVLPGRRQAVSYPRAFAICCWSSSRTIILSVCHCLLLYASAIGSRPQKDLPWLPA